MSVIRVLEAVNGCDVGMIELGQEFGFPLKSGQPLGVLGELLRQHLDGDFTAQVGVLSTVHFAHASFANFFKNFVVRERLANHVS